MQKNIEVEIRGPLTKNEFIKFNKFLSIHGKKKNIKNRILIDYSTFLKGGIRNRNKDIRLRITNGIPEIIVKVGRWGNIEQRKELSILTKPGEFDLLVEIFGELGFNKGVLCERKSKVYDYKGIEFALVEVPKHSYYYEAEKMVSESMDKNKAVEEIKKICKNLNLKVFSKNEFFKYIDVLNIEANKVFDYKDYVSGDFKKKYKL